MLKRKLRITYEQHHKNRYDHHLRAAQCGKSSLTNALVGEKIAIVSDKPQTTRNRIYGVVNREDTQFVLLDTPGLHKPRSGWGTTW